MTKSIVFDEFPYIPKCETTKSSQSLLVLATRLLSQHPRIKYVGIISNFFFFAAQPPEMDCPTIRSGDLVEVELDVEIFRIMQEGHGGWGTTCIK